MYVWGESPLDPMQELQLAEWKMQPQRPSATNNKGRHLIFSQSRNTPEEEIFHSAEQMEKLFHWDQ